MVMKQFLLMIIIGFSFADILNQITPRKLDESYELFGRRTDDNSKDIPKLMVVGLGNYNYSTQNKNLSFSVYFINPSNASNLTNLNVSVQIKNDTNYIPTEILQCFASSNSQNVKLTYECFKVIENITIKDIQIKKNFTFYDTNNKEQDVDIEYSSYYEDSINNLLLNSSQILNYSVFYLDIIEKNNDEYNLTGYFLEGETYNNTYMNLNLSNNILNCSIINEKINFDTKGKNINDKLHGKMLSGNNSMLLIYANDSVIDFIISDNNYNVKNEFQIYMELLNFANYNVTKINETSVAKVDAYFRGDINSLTKLTKFLSFPVLINNSTNIIKAKGKRTYTDLERGYVIYSITFNSSEDIDNITFNKTFNFSNDEEFKNIINIQVNFFQEDLKINNRNSFIYNVVNSTTMNATNEHNSFSLDFNYTDLKEVNLFNNSKVILSFIPQKNTTIRDKINCTLFQKKQNNFNIVCRPKEDVYTFINTLIINALIKTGRLRFLDDENYQPIYTLPNATGSINFEYIPLRNPTLRHTKNSLSAGAIVAIVLCTIAAILAVGVAFFFLSKPSVPPIKSQNQVIISNSTSGLNN